MNRSKNKTVDNDVRITLGPTQQSATKAMFSRKHAQSYLAMRCDFPLYPAALGSSPTRTLAATELCRCSPWDDRRALSSSAASDLLVWSLIRLKRPEREDSDRSFVWIASAAGSLRPDRLACKLS